MKRVPLTRRTGLQSRKGLERSQKPLARSRLKPRSEKTQKRYEEERIPLVKRLLKERPWCEACPGWAEFDGLRFYRVRPSTDIHEILSRGRTGGVHGEEWLDEENLMALCRTCHDRITNNPSDAEDLGFLRKST